MSARLRPPIWLGFLVSIVLALASFSPRVHLGIIEVLFLLGPWVVVPLGATFLRGERSSVFGGVLEWVLFLAASLTIFSFFLDDRITAAWFAGAWLLVCAGFAGDGLRRFVTAGTTSFTQFCFAVGEGYLFVAGIWLVASRAGISLSGFQEPIVLLTGVHFHFAGLLRRCWPG
jgi:YndJ-like protein